MSFPGMTRAWRLCVLCCSFACSAVAAERGELLRPLRVAIVGEVPATDEAVREVSAAVAQLASTEVVMLGANAHVPAQSFAALKSVDAVVCVQGPGRELSAADTTALRAFINGGRGLVVIAARPGSWPAALPVVELIGATPAGAFAKGAPLTVIELFAHPALTGVGRFETSEGVMRYDQLADDAQMIIEGTAGEVTTPLAWVRRTASGRMGHIGLASPALLAAPAYQRLIANLVLWTCARPIPGAQPSVQRTFMPDAHPGAFAITLPNGPGVCLDPVRGGITYVWDGDFVDLRPRWLTKQGEPARIFGEVFYRETAWQPWRAGKPDGEPQFRFRGYTLHPSYPEFHYEIGGREVHEILTTGPHGNLLRRFRVGAGSMPLWLHLEAQPGAELVLQGLERDGNLACYSATAAGEFTIEIRRKAASAP